MLAWFLHNVERDGERERAGGGDGQPYWISKVDLKLTFYHSSWSFLTLAKKFLLSRVIPPVAILYEFLSKDYNF